MITDFGTLPDGRAVTQVSIAGHGLTISLLTFGARVQDLRLRGHDHALVLGWPDLLPYLSDGLYMGAVVGRCANRIGHARVSIDGQIHDLDRNWLGKHQLHGGPDGSASRVWQIEEVGAQHVIMSDVLPDGHMGYPGNLKVTVEYRIMPGPSLVMVIRATCDATTLCNFAGHIYWNLDGDQTIANHKLCVAADSYLMLDADMIPIGTVSPVTGAYDWREQILMADRLNGPLIDYNLCLSTAPTDEPRPVAWLKASNGITLKIATTEPGLQVYAGDHIRPGSSGLNGCPYHQYGGCALEPQIWPDAINHSHFPNAILRPGQEYRQVTTFSFEQAESTPL